MPLSQQKKESEWAKGLPLKADSLNAALAAKERITVREPLIVGEREQVRLNAALAAKERIMDKVNELSRFVETLSQCRSRSKRKNPKAKTG